MRPIELLIIGEKSNHINTLIPKLEGYYITDEYSRIDGIETHHIKHEEGVEIKVHNLLGKEGYNMMISNQYVYHQCCIMFVNLSEEWNEDHPIIQVEDYIEFLGDEYGDMTMFLIGWNEDEHNQVDHDEFEDYAGMFDLDGGRIMLHNEDISTISDTIGDMVKMMLDDRDIDPSSLYLVLTDDCPVSGKCRRCDEYINDIRTKERTIVTYDSDKEPHYTKEHYCSWSCYMNDWTEISRPSLHNRSRSTKN